MPGTPGREIPSLRHRLAPPARRRIRPPSRCPLNRRSGRGAVLPGGPTRRLSGGRDLRPGTATRTRPVRHEGLGRDGKTRGRSTNPHRARPDADSPAPGTMTRGTFRSCTPQSRRARGRRGVAWSTVRTTGRSPPRTNGPGGRRPCRVHSRARPVMPSATTPTPSPGNGPRRDRRAPWRRWPGPRWAGRLRHSRRPRPPAGTSRRGRCPAGAWPGRPRRGHDTPADIDRPVEPSNRRPGSRPSSSCVPRTGSSPCPGRCVGDGSHLPWLRWWGRRSSSSSRWSWP